VALVVSGADRRRGRGGTTSPTAVKAVALAHGLPVTTRVADVVEAGVDLGVVVAFGRLIRPEVLARVPMVNVHFSLLPRWRGAAPVERAILAGDAETGVCLMELEEGLDTGPVYACEAMAIGEDEDAVSLRGRLGMLGTALLLDALAGGFPDPQPQQGEPSYADKITSEELRLDFSLPAVVLARKVRVGPAHTTFRGRRLIIWRAQPEAGPEPPLAPGALGGDLVGTGEGALRLIEVQAEGKRSTTFTEWARGARPDGERLGSPDAAASSP
jgi:methionyl-tRNA formyltransferase